MVLESTDSPQKSDANSSDANGNTPKKPVVIQCVSCRSILADSSTGFLEANPKAGTISFTIASGVTMQHVIKTKTSGNCVKDMLCTQCGKTVGCKFISTTTQFDSIRNAYTFNKSALVTYELSGDNIPSTHTTAANGNGSRNENASISSLNHLLGQVCDSMDHLSNWMRALQKENAELRQNFVALENRLHSLDSRFTSPP